MRALRLVETLTSAFPQDRPHSVHSMYTCGYARTDCIAGIDPAALPECLESSSRSEAYGAAPAELSVWAIGRQRY